MFAPQDVKDKRERSFAWKLFVVIVILVAAACAVVTTLTLRQRLHPPINTSFEKMDIPLPYFYICPLPANDVYAESDIVLREFVAICTFGSKETNANSSKLKDQPSVPLNWGSNSRSPDRTFEVSQSNCDVRSLYLSGIGLCFEYNLTGYTVKKELYRSSYITMWLLFAYRFQPTENQFLRNYYLMSRISRDPLPIVSIYENFKFYQELPLSIDGRVTLSLSEEFRLNGDVVRSGAGTTVYTLPWSNGSQFYPVNLTEVASVDIRLDERGIFTTREFDPVDVGSLLAQYNTFWSFGLAVFAISYGLKLTREPSWLKNSWGS